MGRSISEISPRHRFEARIDIHLQRGEHKLNVQGWVRDLSESGLRAFVADPLVPGELVVCEVPLSNISKQVIPAKVVRALGTDYGFEFTALSGEQRIHIQATLRKLPSAFTTADRINLVVAFAGTFHFKTPGSGMMSVIRIFRQL